MSKIHVILVGGFLGSGKTTLLTQASERLTRQGRRVGLVANDQAADLVDTEILRGTGAGVEEVAGGCFCCRFSDMIGSLDRLVREHGADVLIGEPVGSCTDLSATVLQPLKRLHGTRFQVAPFSVLVDANQVRVLCQLRQAGADQPATPFPDNVLYIYQKQLEEADLIVLNKADRLSEAEVAEVRSQLEQQFPQTPVMTMSALQGDGVDAWLEHLRQGQPAGRKIAAVDYDTYAAGEAALGWMNAAARLRAHGELDWQALAGQLLEAIRTDLCARGAAIAHVKLYLTAAGSHVAGNLTSNDGPLSVRGTIAPATREAALLINARVHDQPERLQATVENCVQAVAAGRVSATITQVRSFFPGRPQPTHRDTQVV
jgi:G3E family GTPase